MPTCPPPAPIHTHAHAHVQVCPAGCTARHLSGGPPLRLLASGLHAHTLGRAVTTRHFRNLAAPAGSSTGSSTSNNATNATATATAGAGGATAAAGPVMAAPVTVELPPVGSRHWYQFDYQGQDPVVSEGRVCGWWWWCVCLCGGSVWWVGGVGSVRGGGWR